MTYRTARINDAADLFTLIKIEKPLICIKGFSGKRNATNVGLLEDLRLVIQSIKGSWGG